MKNIIIKISVFGLFALPLTAMPQAKTASKGYYQVTIYNFTTTEQQNRLEDHLKTAYLPALHKQKISNIGVFKPIANDTAVNRKLYVIIPLNAFEQAATLPGKINADQQYQASGKAYLEATYGNPPYKRMEVILLEQFPMSPFFNVPKLKSSHADRIYELRSYESATEKIFANKVEMFNEGGEIKLFEQLNFNAVFYGSVIAGSRMPNLMYMTSFENINDREEHWKKFGASEEWKKLSALPKYQNNVSKIEIILMKATDYSDY